MTPPMPSAPAATSAIASQSRLMVLLFTDIVGSSDLKSRLGTVEYAELLARHDEIFRTTLASFDGAQILKDTGDGFFASFPTASDAVRAALRFQFEMRRVESPLQARVGLHVGEVTQIDREASGTPKIVGLAADAAARLMDLAAGGQILLTRFAFNDARQFVRSHPAVDAPNLPELRWIAHGEYLFKGNPEPFEVYEVGAVGIAPLNPPQDTEKAHRNVRPGDEHTLGWRPATGLEIPDRAHWIIRQKLGEGGFGEVWLAEHDKAGMRRVMKFCFEPERLRGLKREVVLLRLLKEVLGERRDIARVVDFQFDRSPYFIETEYFPGGTLHEWAERHGGLEKVPLAVRVRIVSEVAEALAAAHGVGVIHKDLKPSNILMAEDGDGQWHPVITDFGIGILTDRSALEKHDITVVGFTENAATANDSSRTGTRMYSPPESLLNRPFTLQGDVYALGVLLYQMVVGDLNRPLAEGWERNVSDALLREDIAACVEGDPARRLGSASELAARLDSLDARRAQRESRRRDEAVSRRRATLLKVTIPALAALVVLSTALGVAVYQRSRRLRSEADARAAAETARERIAGEAHNTAAALDFLTSMLTAADPTNVRGAALTVRDVLDHASQRVASGAAGGPQVEGPIRAAIGNTYRGLGLYTPAKEHLQRAVDLARSSGGSDAQLVARLAELGIVEHDSGNYSAAEKLYRESIESGRKSLGPDSPAVLSTEVTLGQLLMDAGQFDEALPIFQRVYEVRKRSLGEDAPDTITTLRELGLYYEQMADYARAETNLKQVLAVRESKLGADHPYTLVSVGDLAQLYHRQGKLDQAEPYFKRAIELSGKIFGSDHPETAAYWNNAGLFYDTAGRFADAEAAYRQALLIRETALGIDHPSLAATLNNLAMLYLNMNRQAEAAAPLARAVAICEKSLGPEHPDTAAALNNLGTLYDDMGDYASAEPLYQRALAIRTKVLGADHPDTAVAQNNLGLLYLNQARYADAEPLLTAAMEAWRRTSGPDHPHTLTAMSNLGMLYGKTNRLEQAETLHRKALEGRTRTLGADHPENAITLNNIAGIEDQLKRYDDAERDYLHAIEIMQKAHGPGHRQTLTMQVNRAVALKHAGKLDAAREVLRGAIDQARQTRSTLPLVSGLSELADVENLSGRYDSGRQFAAELREEAVRLPDAAQQKKWTAISERLTAAASAAATSQPATR